MKQKKKQKRQEKEVQRLPVFPLGEKTFWYFHHLEGHLEEARPANMFYCHIDFPMRLDQSIEGFVWFLGLYVYIVVGCCFDQCCSGHDCNVVAMIIVCEAGKDMLILARY